MSYKTARRIFAVAILLCVCLLFASPAAAAFSGSGTEADPYLIQSNADMKKLAELVNAGEEKYASAHYLLTADLALEDENWTPIGSSMGKSFAGVFDGNEKTVTYSIDEIAYRCTGLFGSNAGTIQNLYVKCLISGIYDDPGLYAGGITGMNFQGTIENCVSSAEIHVLSGAVYAGGIAGYDSGGVIQECSSEVEISAESLDDDTVGAGGIVGDTSGKVDACTAAGTVYANGAESVYAGGIAGVSWNKEISRCTAGVDVSAAGVSDDMYAGGVAGMNQGVIADCTVKSCDVSAVCSGEDWTYTYAGGITGRNYESGEIKDCVTDADVSASASAVPADDNDNWPQVFAGGLVGYNAGKISDCLTSGSVLGEAEGEVFADALVGQDEGTVKNCTAGDGAMSHNRPSDDSAESPIPALGMVLGGLCAAGVLRRK